MQSVILTEQEWQQVLGLLALAPWRDANPLLMKIGAQLQRQAMPNLPSDVGTGQLRPGAPGDGSIKEAGHG